MAEDARHEHPEGDPADAEQHHRERQPTLGNEPFEQTERRYLELARPNVRRFGHPHPSRQWLTHDCPALTDWDSANSWYAPQVWSS